MDTLTIFEEDVLTLTENDSLRIDQVTNDGSVGGTGTLITDCSRLVGTIDSTVQMTCYVALPAPLITVTRLETDSIHLLLEEALGADGYLIQYATDSSFTDPTEIFFTDSGPQQIEGLTAGTIYRLRGRVHDGTATSTWSNVQTMTLPVSATGTVAFDAFAVSSSVIRLVFPIVSGTVELRRRPTGSNGTWTRVAENVATSPYDDDATNNATLVPNVRYDYQWRVTNRSWVETNVAWLTRTFDRSIRVGRIVSTDALTYKIVAQETDVTKGIE